ncbi:MAG: hypothetical protein U5L05_11390 [Rubrivivax sp.]|nr:hypothetical protein [Rubrivivax sp.]
MHIGRRAFLASQAGRPGPVNAAMLAAAPDSMPRKAPRIRNAQEADWGPPTMKVVERAHTRLAVLDLVLAV